MLLFALTAVAQQAVKATGHPTASDAKSTVVPTADVQLKFLTAQLDLTNDQQEKLKPILAELHGSTVTIVQDQSLSHEERMSKFRDSHYAADKKMRAFLTDDQKKKLDQVEHEPHPELHGNITDSNR
jgi:Spy/CpxP family protein refolding chaperone